MITEGMIGIAIIESPLQLEMRLRSFMEHGEAAGGGDHREAEPAAATNPAGAD
jgi:hypothetical protein